MTMDLGTVRVQNYCVWYAGYGSNLQRRRFDCYISGGTPEGATRAYPGCRDKSTPRADRPITLSRSLYFANHSDTWGGAVAFIRPNSSDALTYGRMYLITYDQFNDVVRQENGRPIPGPFIVPPFNQLAQQNEWLLPSIRLYGQMLRVGTFENAPILTFSATREDFQLGPPSNAYVRTIVSGLEETYPCMRKSEIHDYLLRTDGIRNILPLDLLTAWVLGR